MKCQSTNLRHNFLKSEANIILFEFIFEKMSKVYLSLTDFRQLDMANKYCDRLKDMYLRLYVAEGKQNAVRSDIRHYQDIMIQFINSKLLECNAESMEGIVLKVNDYKYDKRKFVKLKGA